MLKLILFQCQEFIDSRVVGARTRNCSFPVKVKAVDLKFAASRWLHFHLCSVARCVYLQL
jgi:hypothetical protein